MQGSSVDRDDRMRQHRQRMKRTVTVVLERADDGWWTAHAPPLHATAQGKSRATALRRIQGLIAFALDDLRASGQT